MAEYWDSAPAVGKAAKKKGRGGRPANPYLLPPAAYRKPDVQRRPGLDVQCVDHPAPNPQRCLDPSLAILTPVSAMTLCSADCTSGP